MISGVIQKKVPHDALVIAAHDGAQMHQFFDPAIEHLGPNFPGLWISTLQESQWLNTAASTAYWASESPLEIKEPLQGGCK